MINEALLINFSTQTVRVEGLEPPCLAASDPKSDTSTNFATPAFQKEQFTCNCFPWGANVGHFKKQEKIDNNLVYLI